MGVQEPGVTELRGEGEETRRRAEGDGTTAPPGGFPPVLDDDGNPVPDADPVEPTDVPAGVVDAIMKADGAEG